MDRVDIPPSSLFFPSTTSGDSWERGRATNRPFPYPKIRRMEKKIRSRKGTEGRRNTSISVLLRLVGFFSNPILGSQRPCAINSRTTHYPAFFSFSFLARPKTVPPARPFAQNPELKSRQTPGLGIRFSFPFHYVCELCPCSFAPTLDRWIQLVLIGSTREEEKKREEKTGTWLTHSQHCVSKLLSSTLVCASSKTQSTQLIRFFSFCGFFPFFWGFIFDYGRPDPARLIRVQSFTSAIVLRIPAR
jgi:hypothetical protein